MRNKFPGTCYRCGEHVAAGDGHFERHAGGWRTQHATCAIKHRHAENERKVNEETRAVRIFDQGR